MQFPLARHATRQVYGFYVAALLTGDLTDTTLFLALETDGFVRSWLAGDIIPEDAWTNEAVAELLDDRLRFNRLAAIEAASWPDGRRPEAVIPERLDALKSANDKDAFQEFTRVRHSMRLEGDDE